MQDLPPVTTVEAVAVVPARLPAAVSEDAFSVIRLGEEQLDDDRRLDQALAQVPGVTLFRRTDSLVSNPTTQGISLRSIGPSGAGRALVTLDGVPQNDPFGGWVIWTGLPPELIESATIVRGGGAGPYGAGALTGVISLDERTDRAAIANLSVGERDTQRATLVGSTRVGRVDFLGGVYGGRSDGYVPVRYGAGAADSPAYLEAWSASVRASTDLAGGRAAFRVGAFDELRGSGLAGGFARASGEHASLTWVQAPGDDTRGYRLQAWVRTSGLENTFVSVPADRSSTTLANTQFDTPATGYGVNAAVRGGSPGFQWETGADVRIAQGETRERNSFTGRTRLAGGDTAVAGLYAEGTVIQDLWMFTGGVRVDQWSNSDGHRIDLNANGSLFASATYPDRDGILPTARLGVRREIGMGGYFRGAAYTGFRAPSINELHRPFRVGNITTESNADLEPERLAGIEAGFGFEGANSAYDVTLFYNELTDSISNVTIGVDLRQRQNAESIEAVGVEAEGVWRLTPGLTTRAAVAYTDAETEAGLRPQQTARLSATAGADWDLSERLRLSGQVRYEGDRFDDDLNTILLDEAFVVDAQAGWEFGRGVEGYVAVENLFDEDIENGLTSGALNYGAPRIVTAGLKIRR